MEGHSPHASSNKLFKLRVTAHDLEFDHLLANLSVPEARKALPGYLFLFSDKTFVLNESDTDIDGHSDNKMRMQTLQMQASKHARDHFPLAPKVELVTQPSNVLRLQLQLGIQAASRLMMTPFFSNEEKTSAVIPLHYRIPGSKMGESAKDAFSELESYLETQPRGIVDELTLIDAARQFRTYRQRVREAIS